MLIISSTYALLETVLELASTLAGTPTDIPTDTPAGANPDTFIADLCGCFGGDSCLQVPLPPPPPTPTFTSSNVSRGINPVKQKDVTLDISDVPWQL